MSARSRKPTKRPAASTARPAGRAPGAAPSGKAAKPTQAQAGQSAAQRRLAAQRALAAASGARGARRRRLLWSVGAPLVAVLVVAAVIVAVSVSHHTSSSLDHTPVAISASLQSEVTGVPVSVIDAVGTGSGVTPPKPLNGAALVADGKPRVLYVGAEYCPYCGAERWALANALSRFGTLSGLMTTYSSATDIDPNTATLDFHNSSYTSSVISVTTKEIENGSGKPLDTLTSADETLFTTIGGSGFPFIDIGGKFYVSGQSYDPGLLHGKTHDQIAAAMSDPTSPIGKAIIGTANYITAAICAGTNQQPASVCTASGVQAAAAALGITAK